MAGVGEERKPKFPADGRPEAALGENVRAGCERARDRPAAVVAVHPPPHQMPLLRWGLDKPPSMALSTRKGQLVPLKKVRIWYIYTTEGVGMGVAGGEDTRAGGGGG